MQVRPVGTPNHAKHCVIAFGPKPVPPGPRSLFERSITPTRSTTLEPQFCITGYSEFISRLDKACHNLAKMNHFLRQAKYRKERFL